MNISLKGPWDWSQVENYLTTSNFPMRVACIGQDSFPRVVSVWFGYDDGRLLCVSHRSSQLVKLLRKNERVGFEVAPNEPPYYGVRGQGIAKLDSDAQGTVLRSMLERYLGGTNSSLADWLLSRAEDEMLISIEPSRIFSWDYRERMGKDC